MSPLFLPKGVAPDEENEKEGGKNTGGRFNFYDLPFSTVLFTKSGAKCSAWMDGSERTCSFPFLPPSVFLSCSFLPLCPVLCQEPPTFTAPAGPKAAEGRLRQGGVLAAPSVPWGLGYLPAAQPGQE